MRASSLTRAVVSSALAASLVLAGYTAATITQPSVTPAPVQAIVGDQICYTGPVKQAIYGDSETAWLTPFNGDWRQSWVYWASSNDYPAAHGWALPGATLADMAAHATDSDAKIVQIMGGTNDLPIPSLGKPGTPKADMLASIDRIVAIENPEAVVLLAVPPFGWNYYESNTWNEELRQHAAAQGWHFFDPWVGLRDPNGAWWPGTSYDLVHPAPLYTWHPGSLIYSFIRGL